MTRITTISLFSHFFKISCIKSIKLCLTSYQVLRAGDAYKRRNKPQTSMGLTCSLLVHGWLLCTLLARVRLAGTHSAVLSQRRQPFSSLFFSDMAGARAIARAMNSWREEGLDLMGGADGAAIEDLISEFMDTTGNETQPSSTCNTF